MCCFVCITIVYITLRNPQFLYYVLEFINKKKDCEIQMLRYFLFTHSFIRLYKKQECRIQQKIELLNAWKGLKSLLAKNLDKLEKYIIISPPKAFTCVL